VRVEADGILLATEKAKRNQAWSTLTEEEQAQVEAAVKHLESTRQAEDHHVIRAAIDALNEATHKLAENMMNTAVSTALKGTKL
jgi:predicted transcriptional regulator